ncbi:Hypothetical predicted protein [Scomber scombrus]|uniref:Ferric-chelate reductase 1 n=1 Tax=Scomber scombrus TaxID=13677 RepID=A0AAV1Q9B5_SCOSC
MLCAAEPSTCDPSQSGSCFFCGAKQSSGSNFEFSLSGESEGYVAASLSTDTTAGGNDPTYICANDNGVIKFFSALLDNDVLTVTTLAVTNVKGSVNGNKIQCTFSATIPAASVSRRSLSIRAQSFSLSVSTGAFNSTSDSLGSPTAKVQTDVINIANSTSTITNLINTTTTAAAATETTAATATTRTTAAATTRTTAAATTSTVPPLETPVSSAGCGISMLCAAEPSTCDPSQSGSCFFCGAKQSSGSNFEFSLSGESEGYVAASLSTDTTAGGNDPTYICANDNGVIKFFSALLDNDVLTVTTLAVTNVKGSVNGNNIQCTFSATIPAASVSRRSLSIRAQRFSMSVSTGAFNSTSDSLGSPTAKIQTNVIDIANSNATIDNLVNTATTTATPTTSHAVTLQQSFMQALLVTVGVLGLAML